jgi:hypothetical protein
MWLLMITQNSRGTCQPCRLIYLGVAGVLVTGSLCDWSKGRILGVSGFPMVFRDHRNSATSTSVVHRLSYWV